MSDRLPEADKFNDADSMHDIVVETEGEFSGWQQLPGVSFNSHVGPFYYKLSRKKVVAAFRPSTVTGNGTGVVHGGALMSFADFSMFVAAQSYYKSKMVFTISANCQFVGTARPDEYIESVTETVHAGRSLIVLRGTMTSNKEIVLNYSGTFKRSWSR